MIVPLRSIPDEGLDLAFDLSGPFARKALEGTETDADKAVLRAEVHLQRVQHDVYVKGQVMGRLLLPCGRCTDPAPLAVDAPFELTFVPESELDAAGDGEVELTPQDLDVATYVDDKVDLEETLREQLLLSFPMAHVCQESCKGLCATCGKDLNTGPCECPAPPPAGDRWAALKNVKI